MYTNTRKNKKKKEEKEKDYRYSRFEKFTVFAVSYYIYENNPKRLIFLHISFFIVEFVVISF